MRVRCKGQVEEELGLVVVSGEGLSLLGRDWLEGEEECAGRRARKLVRPGTFPVVS